MKFNRKSVLVIGCGAAFVAACSGQLVVDDRKGNLDFKDGGGGATSADASRADGGGVGAGGVAGHVASGGSASGGVDAGGAMLPVASGGSTSRDAGRGTPPRWMGNPSDCPSAQPVHGTSCSAALGRTCAYYTPSQGASIYNFCDCLPATETITLWSCVDNGATGTNCPSTQPEEGSSCAAANGPCQYPRHTTCTCASPSSGDEWHCQNPDEPPLSDGTHPTTLDETKRVRDLTDADRQAWCEWYGVVQYAVYRPPNSLPAETPLSPAGYTTNTACSFSYSGFACSGAMPLSLPISYCKGNLGLSQCDAPVSELSDCVLTMQRECRPSPFGCALYLRARGCSGTIVTAPDTGDAGAGAINPFDTSLGCPVRVR
jgi:hypothetical protein